MFKKILTIIVTTGILFYATAQYNYLGRTARVEALGACALVNDLTYSQGNPSKIINFPDQINMTGFTAGWIAGQFGPLFSTKSFGEHVVLGLEFNSDRYLNSAFYNRAAVLSDNSIKLNGFPFLPKVNLAVKIGEQAFGIGGFYDYSQHTLTKTNTFEPDLVANPNAQGTENTEERDNLVTSPGVVFSAALNLGPIGMEPIFGMAFGQADLEKTTTDKFLTGTTIDSTNTTTELLKDNSALFYNGGLCLWTDIGNTWGIIGAWYKNQEFQLHRKTTIDGQKQPDKRFKNNKYQNLDWLFGIVPTIAEGLFFGLQYDGHWSKGERIIDRTDPSNLDVSNSTRDTTLVSWGHTVRCAIEKEFEGKRFLDKIIPRGGLVYSINRGDEMTNFEKYDSLTGVYTTEYQKDHYILGADRVSLTGGIGIVKGPVQFDLCFDILNYSTGILIGPGLYSMTAIVDFQNFKKKDE